MRTALCACIALFLSTPVHAQEASGVTARFDTPPRFVIDEIVVVGAVRPLPLPYEAVHARTRAFDTEVRREEGMGRSEAEVFITPFLEEGNMSFGYQQTEIVRQYAGEVLPQNTDGFRLAWRF
jgi:hypothetical protein